jgi:LPXTG-site transpeptidase (sortase) family protein
MGRKERRKRRKKRILNFIILITILFITIYIGIEIFREKNFENENYEIKRLYIENNLKEEVVKEDTIYPKESVQQTYKGYDVVAKLEIPKIELETYIINFSESALNVSVTKFWGANANEPGNFCIAGHNFKNKNMFHNLKELEIGDEFKVKDNKVGIVNYEIYNIYTVVPEDVSCLSQNTNGEREVTLITCTNDSKKRIIIKSREKRE